MSDHPITRKCWGDIQESDDESDDEVKTQLVEVKAQLDKVKTQLVEAKAQLDKTKAQLVEANTQLDKAKAQLVEAKTPRRQAWKGLKPIKKASIANMIAANSNGPRVNRNLNAATDMKRLSAPKPNSNWVKVRKTHNKHRSEHKRNIRYNASASQYCTKDKHEECTRPACNLLHIGNCFYCGEITPIRSQRAYPNKPMRTCEHCEQKKIMIINNAFRNGIITLDEKNRRIANVATKAFIHARWGTHAN